MIEKLKTINPFDETEIDMDVNSVAGLVYENTPLVQKINELVDAVNALVYEYDKDSDWYDGQTRPENVQPDAESRPENVQDKFAEQRKWVGKVCWFWDDDNTNSSCGILTSIDTEIFKEPQFVCNDEYDYEHCEPVKPEDNIIYKGGDNE